MVRRAELLGIAADLFAERGYAATTVRDIAEEAGILSGSLYHHFDSKESMVDAILSGFVERELSVHEAVVAEGRGPRKTFESLARAALREAADNRSAILIYRNEVPHLGSRPRFSYLREAERQFERIWVGVLESGIERGEFRDDIDPEILYRLVRDALWTVPSWHRFGSLDPERVREQYLAVFLDGIVARPS